MAAVGGRTLTQSRSPRHLAGLVLAGAVAAVAGWTAVATLLPALPVWLRFALASAALVFGPGALPACRLLQPSPWPVRLVLAFAFGVAFAPVLAHVLALGGALAAYPYVAVAMGGGVGAFWWTRTPPRWPPSQLRSLIALAALATVVSGVAFAHRMTQSPARTEIYGQYDAYDLTYYAAIAAEASHTVPPASPFFAGRMLNHGFYPHVLLALMHRFGDVPILDLYFRYAWPAFYVLAVLACFVFVSSMVGPPGALIASVLFAVGSDFSYLGRWWFDVRNWDDMIWSHNFQGAGAEALLYNNWTPAFVGLFAVLFAVHAACRGRGTGWAVVAGAGLATTVLAKPWVFATVMAALAVTTLTSWRDRSVRRSLLIATSVGAVAAAPLLYRTFALFDNAQVTFAPTFLPLPLVMAGRLGLDRWMLDGAAAFGATGAVQRGVAGLLALPLFLVGSLGYRLVAVPALWRTLRVPFRHEPVWRLMGWTVLTALVVPAVIVSVPYHETTQIHQFALFLLAIFVGPSLAALRPGPVRAAAVIVVVALAVPSTVHYVAGKWNDARHPFASFSNAERQVASVLRRTDPDRTVVLHSRPMDATLLGIESERRSVAAWADYERGSETRRRDVDMFFDSAGLPEGEVARVLETYRPTHVVEYLSRDHINADVRDRLTLLLRNREVAVYQVPESLREPAPQP